MLARKFVVGPVALSVVAAVLLAALAISVLATRDSQVAAPQPAPAIDAHFALSLPDGRRVTEASFRGKWLLVYFGYTSCPDVCPTTLMAMAKALENLSPGARQVQLVFISVDPERDKPAVIADYVKSFDPRFVGLVGTAKEIAAAARQFHVYYRVRQLGNNEYVIDHSSFIYVLDPRGRFVRLLTGDLPGHQLGAALQQLID
jgi:protein SCO1